MTPRRRTHRGSNIPLMGIFSPDYILSTFQNTMNTRRGRLTLFFGGVAVFLLIVVVLFAFPIDVLPGAVFMTTEEALEEFDPATAYFDITYPPPATRLNVEANWNQSFALTYRTNVPGKIAMETWVDVLGTLTKTQDKDSITNMGDVPPYSIWGPTQLWGGFSLGVIGVSARIKLFSLDVTDTSVGAEKLSDEIVVFVILSVVPVTYPILPDPVVQPTKPDFNYATYGWIYDPQAPGAWKKPGFVYDETTNLWVRDPNYQYYPEGKLTPGFGVLVVLSPFVFIALLTRLWRKHQKRDHTHDICMKVH